MPSGGPKPSAPPPGQGGVKAGGRGVGEGKGGGGGGGEGGVEGGGEELVGGRYRRVRPLGRGTYGVVYEALDLQAGGGGGLVALKRVRSERGGVVRAGVPETTVRELRVLETCRHENLVGLREVVDGGDCLWLVLEHCAHDLSRLVDWMSFPFRESEVKGLLLQILRGVAHLHDHWTMHRDLKPSNVLLTASGTVKLCDFGLARRFHAGPREEAAEAQGPLSPTVVTLWYRAPEILLGGGSSDAYDEAVDMWACGCVFAELLKLQPLFPGASESEQLLRIVELLGRPSERIWPGVSGLSGFNADSLPNQPYNHLPREFPSLGKEGLDLLDGLLTFCPRSRLTARDALAHEYFQVRPLPKGVEEMPSFPVLAEGRNGEGPRPLHAPPAAQAQGGKRPRDEGRGQWSNFFGWKG